MPERELHQSESGEDDARAEPATAEGREGREKFSVTYIDLTRHGNRFGGPMHIKFCDGQTINFDDSQELTPRGRENARAFGSREYDNVTLVHPRGGDELRHGQTGEDIVLGSGKFGLSRETQAPILSEQEIRSPSGESKKTKRLKGARRGVGVDYTSAGLMDALKGVKQIINNRLQKLVDGLSDAEQERFRHDPEYRAALREKAQAAGLGEALKNESAVRKAAQGEALELLHVLALSRRGVRSGETKAIPIVGSGMFAESLLKYALVVEDPKTGTRTVGFDDVEEIGGFTKQASAFRIQLTRDTRKGDPRNLDDFEHDTKVECSYIGDPEKQKLFEGKNLSLDWDVVWKLAQEAEAIYHPQEG